jgi:hypothetical protein
VPTTLFEKTESRSKNGYLVAEHRVIEFRMPEKQSNFEVVFHTAARIVDILADRGAGGRCQIEDDGVIRHVKLCHFFHDSENGVNRIAGPASRCPSWTGKLVPVPLCGQNLCPSVQGAVRQLPIFSSI